MNESQVQAAFASIYEEYTTEVLLKLRDSYLKDMVRCSNRLPVRQASIYNIIKDQRFLIHFHPAANEVIRLLKNMDALIKQMDACIAEYKAIIAELQVRHERLEKFRHTQ